MKNITIFETAMDAYIRGDYETALRELRILAEQGNASAQHNLGFMYDKGQGGTQDGKEAVKWYRLAAEQDDADAQNNLGSVSYTHLTLPTMYSV